MTPEDARLIYSMRSGTGTTAMEYQEYRDDALAIAIRLEDVLNELDIVRNDTKRMDWIQNQEWPDGWGWKMTITRDKIDSALNESKNT